MKKAKGFSLVEILIVIGIVGIILVFWGLTLNSKQKETRDLSRIRDIQILRDGLQVVKNETGGYDRSYCQPGSVSACAQNQMSELARYVTGLASMNDPSGVTASCSDLNACKTQNCNYAFIGVSIDDYEILFHLEKGTGSFMTLGCYAANPFGINIRN
ncbi:MAG: hypothetical protein UT32_C0023G0012 [Parcubacteria group bacterium GW2011_GWC2_39_14]|nr:MAG: hypothetical protein UT32_C0023G0012 [Parcubacteria group bacterium GW2011_GWC2_39_14]KKR53583.1 MAG: hypothetical protein UT91_C0025G0012 [Parcubacteria group bacterium GW2011_GWA2_40_23]